MRTSGLGSCQKLSFEANQSTLGFTAVPMIPKHGETEAFVEAIADCGGLTTLKQPIAKPYQLRAMIYYSHIKRAALSVEPHRTLL